MANNDEYQKLKTAVLQSSKYGHIAPALVERIGQQALTAHRSTKVAIKATKNKLHQIGGAYQDGKIDYDWALSQLAETAVSADDFQQTCRTLMRLHTSTRERLPILELFYQTIFAALPPIASVVDVACGLNPLALPWMPLATNAHYTAVDIYGDMMQFLQRFFELQTAVSGQAVWADVIGQPPTQPVDLALILKTLPVLDQVDKTAVSGLLDTLDARFLLITFPVHSLGGRKKGMAAHYTNLFAQWTNGRSWQVTRFEFETELAFLCKTA